MKNTFSKLFGKSAFTVLVGGALMLLSPAGAFARGGGHGGGGGGHMSAGVSSGGSRGFASRGFSGGQAFAGGRGYSGGGGYVGRPGYRGGYYGGGVGLGFGLRGYPTADILTDTPTPPATMTLDMLTVPPMGTGRLIHRVLRRHHALSLPMMLPETRSRFPAIRVSSLTRRSSNTIRPISRTMRRSSHTTVPISSKNNIFARPQVFFVKTESEALPGGAER